MILPAKTSRINPHAHVHDFLGYDQVATLVSPDELRFLCRHGHLTGLDGRPCWEPQHLDELLQTFHAEGEPRW